MTVYRQPGCLDFNPSNHAIKVLPRTTVTKWPRFWKRDRVVKGCEIIVDDPPALPKPQGNKTHHRVQHGLYGLFVEGTHDPAEAIRRYAERVTDYRHGLNPA